MEMVLLPILLILLQVVLMVLLLLLDFGQITSQILDQIQGTVMIVVAHLHHMLVAKVLEQERAVVDSGQVLPQADSLDTCLVQIHGIQILIQPTSSHTDFKILSAHLHALTVHLHLHLRHHPLLLTLLLDLEALNVVKVLPLTQPPSREFNVSIFINVHMTLTNYKFVKNVFINSIIVEFQVDLPLVLLVNYVL